MNIVHSSVEAAWQEVFHFHVHLVPHWRGDDLRLMREAAPASAEDLARTSERLTAR
jgi:histidine triad (HIT) family protein